MEQRCFHKQAIYLKCVKSQGAFRIRQEGLGRVGLSRESEGPQIVQEENLRQPPYQGSVEAPWFNNQP